jgi:hypothetical protein
MRIHGVHDSPSLKSILYPLSLASQPLAQHSTYYGRGFNSCPTQGRGQVIFYKVCLALLSYFVIFSSVLDMGFFWLCVCLFQSFYNA